ncbi:PREDICTED: nucleolar MIF4G [Prunus dulcis]|uniref:PREDICTED: nucleolar MIF4G n=1 Tax=Prunus dulcis TaxID=3755 RepID=A0A5E4EX60_PRUDU|nr:nucleolar MIF4G domain-containing protein 1 [Prunus dulcis]VVA20253.1 PREDICTED: nucleolar MIF4G [Prunus dulcis]
MEKSRREKRKEARLSKNARNHESWLQHKKIQKDKAIFVKSKTVQKTKDEHTAEETEVKARSESPEQKDHKVSKAVEEEKGLKRTPKTNFEKYLDIDRNRGEEDLELERKLAKKLKVKDGKLKGEDFGLNVLFEGISAVDSLGEKEATYVEALPAKQSKSSSSGKKCKKDKPLKDRLENELPSDLMVEVPEVAVTNGVEVESEDVSSKISLRKKHKKRKLLEGTEEAGDMSFDVSKKMKSCATEMALEKAPVKAPEKYVAPHLRSRAGNEPEEHSQIRRRVRGLLNRLSESNVESITGDLSAIFRSLPRSIASQMFSEELLASCAGGPRGNEQYAAVFAALVAGMACSVGIDFGAKLMASLAKTFEDEYHKEDNISLRNVTLLLSHLCIFGVCSSELIYDFLIVLSKRLTEVDVSTILTVLQCCGMKIRADDPLAMKNFIQSVQNRVNELKASYGDNQDNTNSKRMEFMLETICDIKNNKKRSKEDNAQHTRIKKWLQKLRVEDILIRGLKWSKLLDSNKKGQWWLSGDMASSTDNVEEVANTIDKEVLEAQKMLQLAAEQRMNTDARKAIFCIIMSGEDYIDAFEKLLRLDLQGKQDREIMRVIVECCLQEKVFNKYYTTLASKFCEHDKNHKFTLQFCLWDHFKDLESMQLTRSMHLAKFVAEMVSSFTLSLAVLKTVDLADIKQLTAKRIMHFRMLFEAIFEYPDSLIWNIFTRVAVSPELESLRRGIEFFVKYIVETNKALKDKFKLAKKALNNVEGVLM